MTFSSTKDDVVKIVVPEDEVFGPGMESASPLKMRVPVLQFQTRFISRIVRTQPLAEMKTPGPHAMIRDRPFCRLLGKTSLCSCNKRGHTLTPKISKSDISTNLKNKAQPFVPRSLQNQRRFEERVFGILAIRVE
jgi:hypothetical protein